MNRKLTGRIAGESRAAVLAVIAVMLMWAVPSTAADTSTYEDLNAVLSGRMVMVGKKNGVVLKGKFEQITGPTLRMTLKGGAKGGVVTPVEVAVDEVEYIEDSGRMGPKVAGAFAGVAIGALGGISLVTSVADSYGGAIAMLVGSIGAGAGTGSFIGKKVSTERYYLGPGFCVPVEALESGAISGGRQITISGLAGAARRGQDTARQMRGAQLSAEFPAGRRLKVLVDLAFTSSGTVRWHDEYSNTYDGGTHWYVRDEEREERSYEGQVVLRHVWREAARVRPYVEGGYGMAWRTSTSRVTGTSDGRHYENSYDDSSFSWLRIVGGAGCEIGISPRMAIDLRGQFFTLWDNTARFSAGLKYGF